MNLAHLRRPLTALLPALLLLGACGKSDPAPTPAPDQGRILFVHAAANVNTVALKFLVNSSEKASLSYGQSSSYQTVGTGDLTVQVTAGGQTAATQTVTVAKDKAYSFFATTAATSSSVNGLLVPDDVTAPNPGRARIRIVNLSQNAPTVIKLAQVVSTVNGPVVSDIVTNVAANTASAFTDAVPGNFQLSILDATNNVLAEVGDGSGSGTGSRKYEDGKLYTVVVTGTVGSLIPEQKIRVFVSQNN